MSRADYEREAARQDAYIAEQEMLLVEGWIGNDPKYRVPAPPATSRPPTPTSPGCSAALLRSGLDDADVDEPILTVIYTPNLTARATPTTA